MMRRTGVALVLIFACACTHEHKAVVQPPPSPPIQDVVALLPDPETATVGRAIVSSPNGTSVELTNERTATRVVVGQAPGVVSTISEAETQQLFGDALAARPPAPRRFLLYFETGSDKLTSESELVLGDILAFVKGRPAPDVTVVGHTDTTATAQFNIELGLSRATMIRDRLVAVGVDASLISVASHGEADLLVPTPDNTPEPKNRRVEVSVR
jgi:outer membrane protein OmpA-like peptidoglycan-associated protein